MSHLGDAAVSPLAGAPTFAVLRPRYSKAEMALVVTERMTLVHRGWRRTNSPELLDYWASPPSGGANDGPAARSAKVPRAMSDAQRLTLVRSVHTTIYIVMASCVLVVLYAGVTGAQGAWLWLAVALVCGESLVFAVSGMKCPLTAIALKYGARHGAVFDTFLPERLTRHTLAVFGPLVVVGLGLVAARSLA